MAKQGYSFKRKLCIFFLGSFCIAGIILWWACAKANRDYNEAIQALIDDGRIVSVPEFVTEYPKDIEYYEGDYALSTMAYLHSDGVPVLDALYDRQWPWEIQLENQHELVYTEHIDSLESQEEIIQVLKDILNQPLTQPELIFEHLGVSNTQLSPLFTSYHSFRDSGRLLNWNAYFSTEKGDYNEALETYGSVFKLAQHISQLPTITSTMLATGTINNSRVPLSETIIDSPYSDEALESFRSILEQTSFEEYFKIGWQVEMLSAIELMERMRNKNDPEIIEFTNRIPTRGVYESFIEKIMQIGVTDFIFIHDRAIFIRGYHELLRMMNNPLVDINSVQFMKWKEDHTSWRTVMTKVSLNSPAKMQLNILYCELYIEQLKVAIAVNRYVQANKQYPKTMDVLIPAYMEVVPTNPMTLQPMKISFEDMLFYRETPKEDAFKFPYQYFNLAADAEERRLLIY